MCGAHHLAFPLHKCRKVLDAAGGRFVSEQSPIETFHPSIRMLSDEQIRTIHNTSLDILSRTGIVMRNEQARHLLLDGGCRESGGRIKIPERLVMDAIVSAPSRIPMYNRLGDLTMPLEAGKVFFGPGSDCIFTIDLETGERRKATADDIRRIAHLCDGLGERSRGQAASRIYIICPVCFPTESICPKAHPEFVEDLSERTVGRTRQAREALYPFTKTSRCVPPPAWWEKESLAEDVEATVDTPLPTPTPEWGHMVSQGRVAILTQWWWPTFPGLAICLLVAGFNLPGDWLRDSLDPRLCNTGAS